MTPTCSASAPAGRCAMANRACCCGGSWRTSRRRCSSTCCTGTGMHGVPALMTRRSPQASRTTIRSTWCARCPARLARRYRCTSRCCVATIRRWSPARSRRWRWRRSASRSWIPTRWRRCCACRSGLRRRLPPPIRRPPPATSPPGRRRAQGSGRRWSAGRVVAAIIRFCSRAARPRRRRPWRCSMRPAGGAAISLVAPSAVRRRSMSRHASPRR